MKSALSAKSKLNNKLGFVGNADFFLFFLGGRAVARPPKTRTYFAAEGSEICAFRVKCFVFQNVDS